MRRRRRSMEAIPKPCCAASVTTRRASRRCVRAGHSAGTERPARSAHAAAAQSRRRRLDGRRGGGLQPARHLRPGAVRKPADAGNPVLPLPVHHGAAGPLGGAGRPGRAAHPASLAQPVARSQHLRRHDDVVPRHRHRAAGRCGGDPVGLSAVHDPAGDAAVCRAPRHPPLAGDARGFRRRVGDRAARLRGGRPAHGDAARRRRSATRSAIYA